MKVLVNLRDIGCEPEAFLIDEAEPFLSSIYKEIQESFHDFDSSILLPDSVPTMDSFILGCLRPNGIVGAANSWNMDIRKTFVKSLVDLFSALPEDMDMKQLELDTQNTYKVACAARALDNTWFAYTDYATLLDNGCGFPALNVTISDEQLASITANPKDYAIVTVFAR